MLKSMAAADHFGGWTPSGLLRQSMSQKSLQVLRADVFAEPGPWPSHLPLTVAVNASWKADKVQANFGRLEQLSPQEIFAAFIGRVAQAIRDGEDEMTLMAWREMSLSAHIVFKVIDSLQDKLAESISIREKYITTYESLARSVLGRIMEIVHYRRSRDPGHGNDYFRIVEALESGGAAEHKQAERRCDG